MKQLLNKIRKNKDATTVAKNFGYLTAMQVAGYVFPLLTIPYLARVIGVDKFGEIAFAAAIVLWFKTVSEWGFNYTATRDIAQNRDDKDAVSQIFSNVLWARLLLAMLSFALLYLAIELVPYLNDKKLLLLLTFLTVPADIFLPQWFFQGLERMKFITVFSVLTKLLFTIGVFVFIKEKDDFILQPLLTSIGALVSGVGAMYLILVSWSYRLKKPQLGQVFNTIKNSSDVFINTIMPNLYNSFSTVLLGFFGGSTSNGRLDAGVKFVTITQSFMELFSRAFFPFLSRKINKHHLYEKISIYIAFVFALGLWVSAPVIIKLFYTPEFYPAIDVLRVVSFSILFLALIDVYGKNYMIIAGYERELRNITVVWSIVGFILAWPLIYYFDFIGAALTITITRVLLGISIMLVAKQKMLIKGT